MNKIIIYIIDSCNSSITMFDTSTHKFTFKLNIPYLAAHPSVICDNGKIHIFNGSSNSKHLIYSIKNNTFISNNDTTTSDSAGICGIHVLIYNDAFIKFCGDDRRVRGMLDEFKI